MLFFKRTEVGVSTLPIEFQSDPLSICSRSPRGLRVHRGFPLGDTVCLMVSAQRRSGARHSGNYILRRANCIDACSASGREAMLNNDLQNAGASLPRWITTFLCPVRA